MYVGLVYCTPLINYSNNIYKDILGAGSIGMLMAHSFGRLPDQPATTLLFRKMSDAIKFNDSDKVIVQRDPKLPPLEPVTDVLGLPVYAVYYVPVAINNLIVCTKAHQTISALREVAYRIRPSSTIVLLQNGMGLLSEIERKIWPNARLRPNIIIAINTHGVAKTDTLGIVRQNGVGSIKFAEVPRTLSIERFIASLTTRISSLSIAISNGSFSHSSRKYAERLLQRLKNERMRSSHTLFRLKQNGDRTEFTQRLITQLSSSPDLGAVEVSYKEILRAQVQKMVANCCINPLTAILDVPNGWLVTSRNMRQAIFIIISETVQVLRRLPEIESVFSYYESQVLFDVSQLVDYVLTIARNTASNVSSMRADIRDGRTTEIQYLNEYIASVGAEMHIPTPVNSALTIIVKAKSKKSNSDALYSAESLLNELMPNDEMRDVADLPSSVHK